MKTKEEITSAIVGAQALFDDAKTKKDEKSDAMMITTHYYMEALRWVLCEDFDGYDKLDKCENIGILLEARNSMPFTVAGQSNE